MRLPIYFIDYFFESFFNNSIFLIFLELIQYEA